MIWIFSRLFGMNIRNNLTASTFHEIRITFPRRTWRISPRCNPMFGRSPALSPRNSHAASISIYAILVRLSSLARQSEMFSCMRLIPHPRKIAPALLMPMSTQRPAGVERQQISNKRSLNTFALWFFDTFIPSNPTLKGCSQSGTLDLTSNPYGMLSAVLKTGRMVVGRLQWPAGTCGIC